MPLFLLLPAFLICLFMPHIRHKKILLGFNFSLLAIYALYMAQNDISIGIMVYVIGMLGTFSQIIFPDAKAKNPKKYKNIRISIACVFAICGSFFLYASPIDVIAILGFFSARLGEASSNAKGVKRGYLFSASFFLTFALMNGLLLMVCLQTTLILSLLYAIYRKEIHALFVKPIMLMRHKIG